jgi:hypothetical protein
MQRVEMCRLRTRSAAAILLLATVLYHPLATAQPFRPYLVGSRAAGLGGAFTALADDGSGPYYNPGGVAFARASSVSLSVSLYGLNGGSISNALGTGHDFEYSDLQIFPVDTAAIQKVGAKDPETGVAPHSLFFSVIVPDAITRDDRDQLGTSANAFLSSGHAQTVWIGGGYARRFGPVGIGAGIYGLIGSRTATLDLDLIVPGTNQFAILTSRSDVNVFGVVASAGARWDVSPSFRVGLSFFTPELGGGSRSAFNRIGVNDGSGPVVVINESDSLSASPTLPFRVQFGAAWERGPWTLAADLIWLGPRTVWDNPEEAYRGLDRRVIRHTVFNESVGFEYVIARRFPVRAGFFTDFASSDAKSTLVENTSHVDHYGFTLSAGLITEHVKTDVGVTAWFGSGTDIIPDNLDFSRLLRSHSSEYGVYISLGTSYEF